MSVESKVDQVVEVAEKSKEYAMYIFVNMDLKMEKGKIAGQVGHLCQRITADIIRMGYEISPVPQEYIDYMLWESNGSKKVVLKATQEQMIELIKMPNVRYIIDAGRTQIPSGSMTVVGFFPSNKMSELFKSYKLV